MLHDFQLGGDVLDAADFLPEGEQLVSVVASGASDVDVLLLNQVVQLLDLPVQDPSSNLVKSLNLPQT